MPTTARPILLVSHGHEPGWGAEASFLESVAALVGAGLPVVAVFPRDGRLAARAAELGAVVVVTDVPRWADFGGPPRGRRLVRVAGRLLAGVVRAARVLRAHRPACVLVNTVTIPTFAVAAALLRVPRYWMVREHGEGQELHYLLGRRRTLRLVRRLSTRVLACSATVAADVERLAPGTGAAVVYNAVAGPTYPPRPRSGPLRLVVAGRISARKGQADAVRAAALAARTVDLRLRVVGDGDVDALRAVADETGIADRVELTGPVDDLVPVLAEADVALVCSLGEAFGRVTVEAMRAGLPVCGVDDAGTGEIVTHGVDGLLRPVGDVEGMATDIVALATDEAFRLRLAEGAAATAARFGLDAHASALLGALGLDERA